MPRSASRVSKSGLVQLKATSITMSRAFLPLTRVTFPPASMAVKSFTFRTACAAVAVQTPEVHDTCEVASLEIVNAACAGTAGIMVQATKIPGKSRRIAFSRPRKGYHHALSSLSQTAALPQLKSSIEPFRCDHGGQRDEVHGFLREWCRGDLGKQSSRSRHSRRW